MPLPRPFIRRVTITVPTPAPLIVFDDVCVLCASFVRWVIRHDRGDQFRFTSAQGPLGQALYRDLGLNPVHVETNLVVVDGVAYGKLAGYIQVAARLGWRWRAAAGLLRLVPAFLGDWAYDLVARNRYALFGKRTVCWMPPSDVAARVI
ncbi:MAG: thiol-disulfide oxidoreductase DCC family protein [Rhodospirillaceae bacterium]